MPPFTFQEGPNVIKLVSGLQFDADYDAFIWADPGSGEDEVCPLMTVETDFGPLGVCSIGAVSRPGL